ncbi:transcription initiation factor TFIID subunit 3-like [Medicago truncatula]|uniref:transcription initiation factor TFIID subunit 3-like n=1 Tax=Medicago truncatula TaxID=3880 RepID=UPI000D2F43E1|nr:transcription initiation factor TFIID subunit 3-like [Medicago truncatula]
MARTRNTSMPPLNVEDGHPPSPPPSSPSLYESPLNSPTNKPPSSPLQTVAPPNTNLSMIPFLDPNPEPMQIVFSPKAPSSSVSKSTDSKPKNSRPTTSSSSIPSRTSQSYVWNDQIKKPPINDNIVHIIDSDGERTKPRVVEMVETQPQKSPPKTLKRKVVETAAESSHPPLKKPKKSIFKKRKQTFQSSPPKPHKKFKASCPSSQRAQSKKLCEISQKVKPPSLDVVFANPNDKLEHDDVFASFLKVPSENHPIAANLKPKCDLFHNICVHNILTRAGSWDKKKTATHKISNPVKKKAKMGEPLPEAKAEDEDVLPEDDSILCKSEYETSKPSSTEIVYPTPEKEHESRDEGSGKSEAKTEESEDDSKSKKRVEPEDNKKDKLEPE